MHDMELASLVKELRTRFNRLKVPYVTIGQFKGHIHIFVRDMQHAVRIRLYLLEKERDKVKFHRL